MWVGHNTFEAVSMEGNDGAEFIEVSVCDIEWHWQYKEKDFLFFSCHLFFFKYVPGYLNATFHDECGELGHHKVHTFEAGLFEFEDLLFDNRLKRQVRGEKPRSERPGGQIVFTWWVEGST